MSDREKVVKALECCTNSDMNMCLYNCPYHKDHTDGCSGGVKMMRDALALLKEQEPIKPTLSVDTWICSKCGHTLESQELIDNKENPQILIHEQYKYCPHCGMAVKWEE